jgi:hypothetical protein
MTDSYRSNLIKNIEENLQDFQSILDPVTTSQELYEEIPQVQLVEFLQTVTAVEEDVLEMRLKKIIERENPYLPAIQVDQLKQQELKNQKSLHKLIGKFLHQKKEIIKFLYNVPVFYWDRTGFHELEGHVTFEEFIRRMIRNDKLNLTLLRENFSSNHNKN